MYGCIYREPPAAERGSRKARTHLPRRASPLDVLPYICIYMYIYTSLYPYVYIYIYIYIHTCTFLIYIYIYLHIFIYIYLYIYLYTYEKTATCRVERLMEGAEALAAPGQPRTRVARFLSDTPAFPSQFSSHHPLAWGSDPLMKRPPSQWAAFMTPLTSPAVARQLGTSISSSYTSILGDT